MPPDPDPSAGPPSRLPVLFPPGTTPASRRRRLVFVAVYALVAAALVWPLYPLGARAFPLVLGLPTSFAWVVIGLTVGLFALVGLYLGDARDARHADPAAGARRRREP